MVIQMKKILFIGKFNTVFQDISSYFEQMFNVQICVDNIDMVKGMLKLNNPDLVVISLIGMNMDSEKIFNELKFNYVHTPVVCIGTTGELDMLREFIKPDQFTKVARPINNEKILDTVCNLLDVTFDNETIVEKGDGRKTILLVDDNGIQLRTLNDMLKAKYDVQMTTSGMQALTLIGKKKPDVIFLDYEMPMCDGKMTLEMIRELEEAKDIPVVFLTGVNDKEHIEAVLKLKPAGYLLKPASADKIYETLENIL